jgi:aspartyl-tRNA(Asn)/glutamyl-tRNA(Gln) amidotransferase subunit B
MNADKSTQTNADKSWEIVIGLETHAQLTTRSKIFSGASTQFGAPPNTQASAVDLAMPGTLPVMNRGAVERAIRFGLAVGGTIAHSSVFERKNYFYPDLPKGYQISQYARPVVSGGGLAIVVGDEEKYIHLTRAHLEEDAGKLLHDAVPGMTGVDLNRAGTPLLEIVTEPDMRSAAEALAYAKALHTLVRWIGICDGNMQEGSFRCDANVSVRRPGAPLGTRCEIKNLNSFRFLEKAIEYEVRRQTELIEEGGKVVQETRLFDPERGETRSMRSKEDAQDYRYFPDPDLLALEISKTWIDTVRASLPSLPADRRHQYQKVYALSAYDAALLTENIEKSDFFEAALASGDVQPRAVAHWVNGEISAFLNEYGFDFARSPISAQQLARTLQLIDDGTLSAKGAKDVLKEVAHGDSVNGSVDEIVATKGLKQISDAGALEAAVEKVLAAQPKLVDDYRGGKEKAFNALVGQVMKATQGKANPAQVNEILRRRLEVTT